MVVMTSVGSIEFGNDSFENLKLMSFLLYFTHSDLNFPLCSRNQPLATARLHTELQDTPSIDDLDRLCNGVMMGQVDSDDRQ